MPRPSGPPATAAIQRPSGASAAEKTPPRWSRKMFSRVNSTPDSPDPGTLTWGPSDRQPVAKPIPSTTLARGRKPGRPPDSGETNGEESMPSIVASGAGTMGFPPPRTLPMNMTLLPRIRRTPPRFRPLLPLLLLTAGAVSAPTAAAADDPSYWFYVAAESDDTVDLVRFGPDGGELVRRIPVGILPSEIEGPHGVRVSPDGRHWYVSIAHGMPYGTVHKFETGTDLEVGDTTAGLFPATMDISPATGFLFVVNFNLHGDHVPSNISVIDTVSMTEIARIEQG